MGDPIGAITITGPVAISGGQAVVLKWNTTEGQLYEVQSSENLLMGMWTSFANPTGTGSPVSFTTAVENAETFYKVITRTSIPTM